MHERVPLCQDPQTEFAILRESMGVSRINHILRVHGHTILQEQRAAENLRRGWAAASRTALPRSSRRTVRGKRHSVQASPESGTKERETTRLLHTWEPSSRASKQ